MIERGEGWVLNVGSIAGDFPVPTAAVYGASKAFLNSFTEALQAELVSENVHVHLLAPGPVTSELFEARGQVDFETPPFLFVANTWVAEEGVRALLRGRRRRTPGVGAHGLRLLLKLVPRRFYLFLSASRIAKRRRARAK